MFHAFVNIDHFFLHSSLLRYYFFTPDVFQLLYLLYKESRHTVENEEVLTGREVAFIMFILCKQKPLLCIDSI